MSKQTNRAQSASIAASRLTHLATGPAPGYRTKFVYDGLGRLRKRLEYNWQLPPEPPPGGAGPMLAQDYWTLLYENRYLYDGLRVIQERDGGNGPLVSYTRGNDLSGSLEGAGGIGGLLARSHGYSGGNWSTHACYHADGNGNITYLVNSSQGLAASYRYDPFGNTLALSGTFSVTNVYRFSSKERHANSGMYYYLYRFYDPGSERWINRDPIGEVGGVNLYSFVRNQPTDATDPMGLAQTTPVQKGPPGTPGAPGQGDGGPDYCEKLARAIINLTAQIATQPIPSPNDTVSLAIMIGAYRARCGPWPPGSPEPEKPRPPQKPWYKRCWDWFKKQPVIISDGLAPKAGEQWVNRRPLDSIRVVLMIESAEIGRGRLEVSEGRNTDGVQPAGAA